MKKIRTAIIGLGRIGWNYHLPVAAAHEGFEVTAVVDPLDDRRQEAIAKYGVRAYKTYGELLDNERLDLVVLASPTNLHAKQAIEAMNRGIDVFCDKPAADSFDETRSMFLKMKESSKKLMVFQPHRISNEVQALKKIIESGILGTIHCVEINWVSFVRRNDWQTMKKYGGGILNNYGAHAFDACMYLLMSKITRIACAMRKVIALGDAEDNAKILAETDKGHVIDIDISWASAIPKPTWSIYGSRGSAVMDRSDGNPKFNIRYFDEKEVPELELHDEMGAPNRSYQDKADIIPWREKVLDINEMPRLNYYDKCYEYFATGQQPFVPFDQTLEVMRLIEECRKYADLV